MSNLEFEFPKQKPKVFWQLFNLPVNNIYNRSFEYNIKGIQANLTYVLQEKGKSIGCLNEPHGNIFLSSVKIVVQGETDKQGKITKLLRIIFTIGTRKYEVELVVQFLITTRVLTYYSIILAIPTDKISIVGPTLNNKNIFNIVINSGLDVNFNFDLLPIASGNEKSNYPILFAAHTYTYGLYTTALEFNATSLPNLLTTSSLTKCPKIKIFAGTDIIYGANLSQVIFKVIDCGSISEYQGYPPLTSVVRPPGCETLVSKVVKLDANMGNVITYGMLRYFIWFLIEEIWDLTILRRSRICEFFSALEISRYACFIHDFRRSEIKGYDQYFIM